MTFTLGLHIKARLLEKAQQQRQGPDMLANDVLADCHLAAEASVSAADIRTAPQAEHAKPIEQCLAEQQVKLGYPHDWPPCGVVQETLLGTFKEVSN